MANEPDSLVLVQLREIRATLAEHSTRFTQLNDRITQMDDRFTRRFDQSDERFDDLYSVASHTLILSTSTP